MIGDVDATLSGGLAGYDEAPADRVAVPVRRARTSVLGARLGG